MEKWPQSPPEISSDDVQSQEPLELPEHDLPPVAEASLDEASLDDSTLEVEVDIEIDLSDIPGEEAEEIEEIERESNWKSSGSGSSSHNDPTFSDPESRRDDYSNFERIFAEWKRTGDPKLRERMIFMHRNLVTYLARRFVDRGDLYEDVVQVGMMALINALDNFNLDRGVKFSTFAIPSISGEIRRYFRDKVNGMRIPRRLQELYLMIHPHVEVMTQTLKRAPTYAEIAFDLKIEVEEVVEALELGSALDPSSLDDFMYQDSESGSVADSLGAVDPQLYAYEEHSALQAALEKLTVKERRVLEMAYFEGHSQAEIARRLGVSQMHISRLLRKALSQLRQLLEEV